MQYCKSYDRQQDVDCKKCSEDNQFPYNYCCLNECGEHEWCKSCKSYNNTTSKDYLRFKSWLLGRIQIVDQRLEHISNVLTKIDFEARKNVLEEVLEQFEKEFEKSIK